MKNGKNLFFPQNSNKITNVKSCTGNVVIDISLNTDLSKMMYFKKKKKCSIKVKDLLQNKRQENFPKMLHDQN